MTPAFSIVIPTFRRGTDLAECLASVCALDYPKDRIEVIIVDNGIHTGSTMQAAIRAIRKLDVRRVVAAIPVSDLNSRDAIESAADEVVCLAWIEKFGHVGLWYQEFIRPTNDQILSLYLNCEEND